MPTLPFLDAPHTVKPYRIKGYVVVGWALSPGVDDPDFYEKVRRYTLAVQGQSDVLLLPTYADKPAADEAIMPESPEPRWVWRLRARWLNWWRMRANRRHEKQMAKHFSDAEVLRRVAATQSSPEAAQAVLDSPVSVMQLSRAPSGDSGG